MKTYVIYKATSPSGHSYIGLTCNFNKRKVDHECAGRNNNPRIFYKAMRKYGSENIEWTIIHDNINSKEEAQRLEKSYIEKYNTFNKGYNMTIGGDTGNGELVKKAYENPEIRVKLAEAHGSRPFYVCDLEGNIIDELINKSECARKYDLKVANVSRCLLKKEGRKQTKGYTFWFKDEYDKDIAKNYCKNTRINLKNNREALYR